MSDFTRLVLCHSSVFFNTIDRFSLKFRVGDVEKKIFFAHIPHGG